MKTNKEKTVILAIDDDAVQLKVFHNILHNKFDIHEANSASTALNFLNTHETDLILLDIAMPNISGFNFLYDIRTIPSYMTVPIIIVSGKTGHDFFVEAKKSSAFDVLTKPVDPDLLISTIKKALAAAAVEI